jgi:hypothetical protein
MPSLFCLALGAIVRVLGRKLHAMLRCKRENDATSRCNKRCK